MTRDELRAIEDAIVRGVEAGLEAALLNPDPKHAPPSAILHNARFKVVQAVQTALAKVRGT